MQKYAKAIVALLGAVATWAATYFPDNHDVQTWLGLAGALVTVVLTYAVPNAGFVPKDDLLDGGH